MIYRGWEIRQRLWPEKVNMGRDTVKIVAAQWSEYGLD